LSVESRALQPPERHFLRAFLADWAARWAAQREAALANTTTEGCMARMGYITTAGDGVAR
jgi:hypothetical protein